MTQQTDEEYVVLDTRWPDKLAWLALRLLMALVPFVGLVLDAPWHWYVFAICHLFALAWLDGRA